MTASKSTTELNYRELNAELEMILQQLQSDSADIDEALRAYERGLQIVKELEHYLKTAENKITKLKAAFTGEV